MKQKFYILLLLLFSFYASFSQKTIRDYWDYKKTKIKEEVQMNAMGQGQGFYRSYYYRGGFKETGFFTNGKKTGLWSQYREGATKPWYQSNMIYSNGYQYKTMEKYWFEDGADAGKLKEWKEWDVSKYREGGADFLEGEFLKVKHVLYINTWNDDGNVYPIKYMMRYDLDIRETLPLEKRYYKEYNKNGTFSSQWIYTKTGDKIQNKYDENGVLTEQNITNTNVWSELDKFNLEGYYQRYFQMHQELNLSDNFINEFSDCVVEKIMTQKPYNIYKAESEKLQNIYRNEMLELCNKEFFPEENKSPEYKEAIIYGNLGVDHENIDSCIAYSKKALSIYNNLIYCKLNLGLYYLQKNDVATAKVYYIEAIDDIKKFKGKYKIIYELKAAKADIIKHRLYHDVISKSKEAIKASIEIESLFEKEILNYK